MPTSIRIAAATPEADLTAAVWPGLSTVYFPRTESAEQIHEADTLIARLEKMRGLRPGTVEIVPLIESPRGVIMAREIARSSSRVTGVVVGPNLDLGGDALAYARAECELAARVNGVGFQIGGVLD